MSGAWEELRKPVDKLTSQASQNAKHLGQDWNLSYLEEEGAKNEKNPGRAYGKAAQAVASWYLGGLLGGAGAAGGAAGEAATETAGTVAEEAAKEAMKQEMLNSAQLAGQQGGLLGGAMSMAPGPGVVAPGMQNAASADTALINAGYPKLAGGKLTGLLGQGSNSPASKFALKQGAKSLMEQPQPPQPSPYRAPQQQQPMPQMYGDPMAGLSEEEKYRLLMMQMQGGMR